MFWKFLTFFLVVWLIFFLDLGPPDHVFDRVKNFILKKFRHGKHFSFARKFPLNFILEISSWNFHLANFILSFSSWKFHLEIFILEISSWKFHLGHFILKISSWNFHLEIYILKISTWNFPVGNFVLKILQLSCKKVYTIIENHFYKCNFPIKSKFWSKIGHKSWNYISKYNSKPHFYKRNLPIKSRNLYDNNVHVVLVIFRKKMTFHFNCLKLNSRVNNTFEIYFVWPKKPRQVQPFSSNFILTIRYL